MSRRQLRALRPARGDRLDRLVADSAREHAGRHDRGRLGRDAGAGDDPPDRRSGSATEESRQRRRELDDAEALQRRALRALLALERGALAAFAEVRRRARCSAGASVPSSRLESVPPPRRRSGLLELLAQRTACAEDQGLHRGDRKVEDLADLAVRAPLELAHDQG